MREVPPVRDTTYADQDLPRHFLRVRPAARPGETWLALYGVGYTLPDGRKAKLKTGNPRTMDLKAARAAARLALARVDAGADPAAEKAKRRTAWTVAAAWEAYQHAPEFTRRTPRSQAGMRSAFINHILPRIGREQLGGLDVPAIKRLVTAITGDTRTNSRRRRRGGAGAARSTTRLLSTVITWSVGEGQVERNVLIGGLRLSGDGQRETVITSPKQYIDLFGAMDRLVEAGSLRRQSRVFITVAALTGMRRSELQHLTVGQVDLGDRRVTLTSSKGSKLAKRGPRTETVSLPTLACAALAEIIPADAKPDDQVFVPYRGATIEINRDWLRVRAAAGLPEALTLHGLRHSIGTNGVLSGLSAPEVQKLLRHRNISTTARYVHLAEATQNRLQDRATAHLLPDPRPVAEVSNLPTRRA